MSESVLEKFIPMSGKTFIDIGGGEGEYSNRLIKSFDRVVSFEPDPRNFKLISGEKYKVALTNTNGQAIFYQYEWANQSSLLFKNKNLSPISKMIKGDSTGSIVVNTKKLDSYRFTDVDFIKIDVEGAEIEVILGAIETIKNNHPRLIIEYHGDNKNLIEELLKYIGYETHSIQNQEYPNGWVIGI